MRASKLLFATRFFVKCAHVHRDAQREDMEAIRFATCTKRRKNREARLRSSMAPVGLLTRVRVGDGGRSNAGHPPRRCAYSVTERTSRCSHDTQSRPLPGFSP